MKTIIIAVLLITLAPTAVLAQAPATSKKPKAAVQDKPITIKGHTLGEAGTIDCAAETAAKRKVDASLESSANVKDSLKEGIVERTNAWEADCLKGNWSKTEIGKEMLIYEGGKLVSITIMFDDTFGLAGDTLLADARERFGPPTIVTHQAMQNGFGARWTNDLYQWELPGVYSTLYLDGGPTGDRLHMLTVMTAAHHAADLAASQERKKPSF